MELINDELRKKFEQYPLGSQDGKGFDAVCIAKYFVGNCTWLATEAEFDDENEEVLLYGYADSRFFCGGCVWPCVYHAVCLGGS